MTTFVVVLFVFSVTPSAHHYYSPQCQGDVLPLRLVLGLPVLRSLHLVLLRLMVGRLALLKTQQQEKHILGPVKMQPRGAAFPGHTSSHKLQKYGGGSWFRIQKAPRQLAGQIDCDVNGSSQMREEHNTVRSGCISRRY